MLKKRQLVCGLMASLCLSASAMAADDYPNRVINLVVPLSPGITLDVVARLYADKLTKILGQPVIVVNKPGAGGIIGAQYVATAPADGYNFLMTNSGHVILPVLNKNLPFDPLKDFKAVAMIADAPSVVIVSSSLGVNDLEQFVALAKSKPGTINYGSAGLGSPTHIAGAYFAQQANILLTHVPYKLSSDIVSDILGGRIQAVFAPPAYLPTLINEGKLKALAVGADKELKAPFRAATAKSQGVNYINTTWYGVLAPAKTPAQIVEKVHRAIAQVSQDPEVKEKLRAQGLTNNDLAPGEFDAFLRKDSARLTPLLKGTELN